MINQQNASLFRLYGLKNCDTVRKARKFLNEQAIPYTFHDYRTDGIDLKLLETMTDSLSIEQLLNKRGTTWRNLPEATRQTVTNQASACRVMLKYPAVIKRPVLISPQGRMQVGFDAKGWLNWLQEEE